MRGQTESEQSRDKCDMRLLTIYQHVECGRDASNRVGLDGLDGLGGGQERKPAVAVTVTVVTVTVLVGFQTR